MTDGIQILKTILPVVLTLVIGMICRRFSVLDRRGIDALRKVATSIALPAVLLHSFAAMEYSANSILLVVMMFGVCVAAWFLGRLLQGVFKMPSRFVPFLTTGFEAGMLGYALFPLLYGTEKLGSFAGLDLGQVLFVFTLYKVLLGLGGKNKPTAKQLAADMLRSPIILAILAGVLLGATGAYRALVPSGAAAVLDACTDFISAPTGMVILLTIGYDIVLADISWKQVGKAVGLRFVIMLALRLFAGWFVRAIGLGDSMDAALNIMFLLPPPYVLPLFSDDETQQPYISSAISVSTLVTVVGFIVITALGI